MKQLTFASDGVAEVLLALTTFRNLFTDLRGKGWGYSPHPTPRWKWLTSTPCCAKVALTVTPLVALWQPRHFDLVANCLLAFASIFFAALLSIISSFSIAEMGQKVAEQEVAVRTENNEICWIFLKSVEAFVYTSPKPSYWGFKNEWFYTPFSRLKGLLASWNHPREHSLTQGSLNLTRSSGNSSNTSCIECAWRHLAKHGVDVLNSNKFLQISPSNYREKTTHTKTTRRRCFIGAISPPPPCMRRSSSAPGL